MSGKALAPGSLILVTGINGYIASHIADQLMSLGYRVRGTARDQAKIDMIGETLRRRNPSASFEGIVLEDVTKKEAFTEAVKGVDGVAHVATDVSFNPNPNQVVPPVVRGVRNALEAANESGSVKRFVYTSSSIAAVHPTPDTKFHVDSSSWNEIDLRDAWAPPPYEASRAFPVYGASKVEGERAAWDFMKTENPEFILNTVLPNLNVGPRLNPKQGGSTSGWVQGLFEGDEQFTQMMLQFPPQYHVDVRDTAAIHVAALLEDDVKGERLFAFAEPYNYSMIVDILKKIDPSRSFPAAPENEGVDLSTVDTARAEELLKRMGRDHFISFEQSLQEQLKL